MRRSRFAISRGTATITRPPSSLKSFRGKSRVQQHQIVYEALKAEMGGKLHALALQTGTPDR